jgi:hypothetical protein
MLTAAADTCRDAVDLDDDTLSLAYVTSLIFGKTARRLDPRRDPSDSPTTPNTPGARGWPRR